MTKIILKNKEKIVSETKEKEHKHFFIPIAFTLDRQVFGTNDEEEIFLEGKGFVIVECSECQEIGYCILD